jgi:hypothetical protein
LSYYECIELPSSGSDDMIYVDKLRQFLTIY